MQWKPSNNHTLASQKAAIRTTPFEVQRKLELTKRQPVCFAHEGFAVAGAVSEKSVYVWDTERGDQLLSLDHGGKFPKYKETNTESITEGSKVRTLVVR
jgi:hypothetical protein